MKKTIVVAGAIVAVPFLLFGAKSPVAQADNPCPYTDAMAQQFCEKLSRAQQCSGQSGADYYECLVGIGKPAPDCGLDHTFNQDPRCNK
jgi:hypothetical protein